MIHFLMTISRTPARPDSMFFHAECFCRSLELTNPHTEYCLTIVVTGVPGDAFLYRDNILEQSIKSNFRLGNAEILFSPVPWTEHPPVRWFVEPKSPLAVFVDADVLVCGDVRCLEEYSSRDVVAAVPAYMNSFEPDIWEIIFEKLDMPYTGDHFYPNYGMVCVGNNLVQTIKEPLKENLYNVMGMPYASDSFFIGQIALSLTVEQLKLKTEDLPARFNYPDSPDKFSSEELMNIKFFHYLVSKEVFSPKLLKSHRTLLPKRIVSRLGELIDSLCGNKYKLFL